MKCTKLVRHSNSISSTLVIHLFVRATRVELGAAGKVNLHDLFHPFLSPFLSSSEWKIIFTQIIVKVTNTQCNSRRKS